MIARSCGQAPVSGRRRESVGQMIHREVHRSAEKELDSTGDRWEAGTRN